MKKLWHILYYETEEGICELKEFINSRKPDEKMKIASWISYLEEKGPELPRPYADLLRDGIHELRIKLTGSQVRVLYFFYFRDMVVLTHAFIKNSAQVPPEQIKKALKIKADVMIRFKKREDLYDSFS